MKIKRAKEVNLIIGLLLLLCVVLSSFQIFSIISIVLFVAFLIVVANDYTIFFIKYFYNTINIFSTIVSCIVIEFNYFYMSEMGEFSSFAGSIPLLVFSFYILIQTIMFWDKKYYSLLQITSLKIDEKNKKTVRIVGLITLAIAVVCFLIVLPHPSFSVGMERADYAQTYGLKGIASRLAINIPRLIIFPLIMIVMDKGIYKKIGIGCLGISVLYYVWTGNKFGAFYQLMCIGLMVLADYMLARFGKKKLFALYKKIGIVFGGLVLAAVIIQSFTYNGLIKNYFFSRIAAEGQLWWKTFDMSNGFHLSELGDELQVFELGNEDVRKSIGAHYGIYKVMYTCAPKWRVDSMLSAGYRYTEAGYAAAYYYLGFLGSVIYAVIMGTFFSLVTNKLFKAINHLQIIRIFIYMRFWLYGTTAFCMFIFSPFFTLLSLIFILYLLFTHNKQLRIGSFKL